MKKHQKLLSVIVPTFRHPKTIKADLKNIVSVLEQGLKDYDFEITCIVDGNVDDTYRQAKLVESSKIKVFTYEQNRGKGYAVRFGMARSRGDLVSFLDSGREISPAGIMMLMAHMEWYNADVVIGSKRHPVSQVNYPPLRHFLSIGYHLSVKLLFGIPLTDTQSGIKVFKRAVIEKVLPRLKVSNYAMDIEILAVARSLGFKRIFEAPIQVNFNRQTSKIRWHTIFRMLWDTWNVFYRLKILKYYDDGNRKNWSYDPDLESQRHLASVRA